MPVCVRDRPWQNDSASLFTPCANLGTSIFGFSFGFFAGVPGASVCACVACCVGAGACAAPLVLLRCWCWCCCLCCPLSGVGPVGVFFWGCSSSRETHWGCPRDAPSDRADESATRQSQRYWTVSPHAIRGIMDRKVFTLDPLALQFRRYAVRSWYHSFFFPWGWRFSGSCAEVCCATGRRCDHRSEQHIANMKSNRYLSRADGGAPFPRSAVTPTPETYPS